MLDPVVRNPDDTIPETCSGQVSDSNAERTRPAWHISVRTQDAENWTNGRTSCYAHDKGDTGYPSAAIKSNRSSGSSQRLWTRFTARKIDKLFALMFTVQSVAGASSLCLYRPGRCCRLADAFVEFRSAPPDRATLVDAATTCSDDRAGTTKGAASITI
jgi:hypothetical protein